MSTKYPADFGDNIFSMSLEADRNMNKITDYDLQIIIKWLYGIKRYSEAMEISGEYKFTPVSGLANDIIQFCEELCR